MAMSILMITVHSNKAKTSVFMSLDVQYSDRSDAKSE